MTGAILFFAGAFLAGLALRLVWPLPAFRGLAAIVLAVSGGKLIQLAHDAWRAAP